MQRQRTRCCLELFRLTAFLIARQIEQAEPENRRGTRTKRNSHAQSGRDAFDYRADRGCAGFRRHRRPPQSASPKSCFWSRWSCLSSPLSRERCARFSAMAFSALQAEPSGCDYVFRSATVNSEPGHTLVYQMNSATASRLQRHMAAVEFERSARGRHPGRHSVETGRRRSAGRGDAGRLEIFHPARSRDGRGLRRPAHPGR